MILGPGEGLCYTSGRESDRRETEMRKVIVTEWVTLDGVLLVIGSTELVRTLIEHDLVDEFRLMIDPLVVGGGKRIFGADGALRPLRLVDHQVTTTGAILATYAPAPG